MFLKPGSYRVKVVAGPRIWWNSFEVDKEERQIALDFGGTTQRNLMFNLTAQDADTGVDITNKTAVTVEYRGRWVPISEIPVSQFQTDTVWRFRASAQGYRTELFSLRIDWYQDELYIEASLRQEDRLRSEE
jgi:serine/threonine-protein kinase